MHTEQLFSLCTEGVDFSDIQQQFVFLPGNTQPQCVLIHIVDDAIDENNETFAVTLSSRDGEDLQSTIITIIDNGKLQQNILIFFTFSLTYRSCFG